MNAVLFKTTVSACFKINFLTFCLKIQEISTAQQQLSAVLNSKTRVKLNLALKCDLTNSKILVCLVVQYVCSVLCVPLF